MHPRLTSCTTGVFVVGWIGTLLTAQSPPPPSAPPPSAVSFEKDAQPILETSCLSCHREAVQSGKLDLRSRESALKRDAGSTGATCG